MAGTCLDENTLVELVEGQLSEATRAEIEGHIDGCAACRALVAAVTATPVDLTEPPRARGSALLRYLILDVIGAGGSGVVYAAYDPELDRKVAIKVMRSDVEGDDEQRRSRTLREAQAIARLSHPNVVAVHDVGTVDDKVFLVIELVDGRTLAQWRTEAPRTWGEVIDVFILAGRGLAAAHAAGLVHRDFKPDNVLIGNDARVLVTDFGLARAAGALAGAAEPSSPEPLLSAQLTRSGVAAGTPAYMAPEQLRGEPVDARVDIFSFCVALYESLYEQRPFAGETIGQIEEEALAGRVRPAPKSTRVPAYIHRLLVRGLSALPEARFASMNELLALLYRDPARRRARIGLAITAVALVAAVVGVTRAQRTQASLCKGAERALAGTWDAARKQELHAALVATGAPFAEDTWRSVEAALDLYTRQWTDMRTQACEATRVTGVQTAELMQLRMSCLDHRLDELHALTSLLSVKGGEPAEDPARAAYKLSPLSECADSDALRATVPPPREPQARAEVERLRKQIAEAKALHALGRYREQAERASQIVTGAKALGYRPLEAQALLVWGMALENNSDYARAADTLREAVWAAEEGHDLKLAVRARAELVWTVHQQGKPEQGIEYARDGRAMLAGLGGDSELEALLADALSTVLGDQGHDDEAMKLSQLVLEKRRASFGPDHPQTAIAMVNVAVGFSEWDRPADALPMYQQALAIYGKAFGTHHPLYAHTLFNIADAEMNLGRYAEARADAEKSLALIEAALGPSHALVASVEYVLGLIAHRQGRNQEARAHHERALALAEKLRGPRHVFVARYLVDLGVAVDALGEHARALELFRRALSIYDSLGNEVMAARSWGKIGHVQLELGARADAVASLKRALRVQEPKDKSAQDLADTRFLMAQALGPESRARARQLAEAALAGYTSAGPASVADRDEVARWLEKE